MIEKKKNEQEPEEENGGFRVTDKRKFSSEGERKAEAETPAPEKTETESAAEPPSVSDTGTADKASSGAGTGGTEQQPPDPSLMEVNFANFILSLGTSAMLHFGEVADPLTGKAEKNLPVAKHTIDVISMLKEKTAGNLSEEEASLIDDLLYQLRMKYVSLT